MVFDKSLFIKRFVDEAREHCATLNDGFLSLEKDPNDTDVINKVFRAAHSIKGSSRMMKLLAISAVAHKMEDILDALKQHKLILSSDLLDVLFRGVDAIIDLLDKTSNGEEGLEAPLPICDALECALDGIFPEVLKGTSCNSGEVQSEPVKESLKTLDEKDDSNVVKGVESALDTSVQPGLAPQVSSPASKSDHGNGSRETVRVESEKLDRLIKLMGEIVSGQTRFKTHLEKLHDTERMAHELVENFSRNYGNQGELETSNQLHSMIRQVLSSLKENLTMQELLAGELQDVSLRMRMVPLSSTFDPLKRAVRDLARHLDRKVDFVVEGGETQLDKKIVEQIGDPLMHMIRNSLDHGIESPSEREVAGKTACGNILLAAYREGGNVTIQLTDDGQGICPDKVRERARKKNLFTSDLLDAMSDGDLINLIFEPGFSTSEIITDISGRGVGMDVVKRNFVEELKGSVTVQSHKGQGTTFYITLPQTLAIFPLLFLDVSGKIVAIPSDSVCEIVSVEQSDIIDVVNKKAVRLRNQIIPVEELSTVLDLPRRIREEGENVFVAIVLAGKDRFGVLFDEVVAEEDLVVKPLPSHMKKAELVSGVVIGGSNEIINVLNLNGLYQRVRQSKGVEVTQSTSGNDQVKYRLLVVDDSINTREIEKSILEAYGYQVTTAEDGQEAYELACETKFDLVVTDVEMPRMDGFTLTEKLRHEPDYQMTPIVIVTSLEKEEDKQRGVRAGADAYIVKGSFDQTNLLDTVKNLIG